MNHVASSGGALNLQVDGTSVTPSVTADWNSGQLSLEGESYPENTYEIYDGIISWVEAYLKDSGRPLRVKLHLNYVNTSSIRAMIDIFDRLQVAHDAGHDLSLLWLYDSRNPRSAELGEEFKEDYTFQFDIDTLSD